MARSIESHAPGFIVATLIILFLMVYFWPRILVSVGPGHAGVLYRRFAGGTVVDRIYGEGLHIVAPWDFMTIYDVRNQIVTHRMEVLTRRGLPITIKMIIRYKPEYDVLGVLQKQVGPRYLQKIVMPEVEATLRQLIGNYEMEEVYETKRSLIEKLLTESLAQASQRYVIVDSVLITEVDLPKYLRKAIESKLEQQQLAQAYTFRLDREEKEAQRKRIEAGGVKAYNDIVSSSLSPDLLTWQGIQATRDLATSNNAKVVVIGGGGKSGLPVILNPER